MNITVDRRVLEMALEALDYEAREEPESSWKKERDALRVALGQQYMTNAAGELEPVTIVQTGVGIGKLKPLSDEEIQALWEKAFDSGSSPRDFARAIEAAHSRQDDYELLGYVELGGYFGIDQARKNGLSGVLAAIYVEPLLPEPNNDLTQMVPIYIKREKEKPTT